MPLAIDSMFDYGCGMDLGRVTAELADLDFGQEMDGRGAFDALREMLTLVNVAHHHAAVLVGVLDRLRVTRKWGGSLRKLLIDMGCAPSVASRLVRVGVAPPDWPMSVGIREMGTSRSSMLMRWSQDSRTSNDAQVLNSASKIASSLKFDGGAKYFRVCRPQRSPPLPGESAIALPMNRIRVCRRRGPCHR